MAYAQLYPCNSNTNSSYILPPVCLKTQSSTGEGYVTKLSATLKHNRKVHVEDKIRSSCNILSFTEDVVKERCFHMMPYNQNYLNEVLDPSGILSVNHTQKKMNPRKACVKKQHTALKPSKKLVTQERLVSMVAEDLKIDLLENTNKNQQHIMTYQIDNKPSSLKNWDEYLIMNLSEKTAQWIVRNKTSPVSYKEKLQNLLVELYGPIDEDAGKELVEEDASDLDENIGKDLHVKKKYEKENEILLTKVRDIVSQQTSRYADEDYASMAFYRLPVGRLQKKRNIQRQKEPELVNQTAQKIQVECCQLPATLTLKDILNPKVGNKFFQTSDEYELDWLTGKNIIHQNNRSSILLDNKQSYRIQAREKLPFTSESWFLAKQTTPTNEVEHMKHQRGFSRWRCLPRKIEDENLRKTSIELEMKSQNLYQSAKYKPVQTTMTDIVNEWRNDWQLDMQYSNMTPDDLIRQMADTHIYNRLKAIITCARAVEFSSNTRFILPDELYIALELCLHDGNELVQQAASITLYALERPVVQAEEILHKMLNNENSSDRWIAARCLACYRECDDQVVGVIIDQLFTTDSEKRRQQATDHLIKQSELSTLVHSLLGERMNSDSWHHRVMACKLIGQLRGQMNKDLVSKLSYLLWYDWHPEVRKAAGQCLGMTGHGTDIHNQLMEKMMKGDEKVKVDAISKIGHLGIMTAKLLPVFIQCFDDKFSSVRMEACITCSNLNITDEQILMKLVTIVQKDPVWKIKALAIQALGHLQVVNPAINKVLIWALCYENEEGVRLEACRAIGKLRIVDFAPILQERQLIERSDLVKKEISDTLVLFGVPSNKDTSLVTQIKTEVRELCTINNICKQIFTNDEKHLLQSNKGKMLYSPIPTTENNESRSMNQIWKFSKFDQLMKKLHTVPSNNKEELCLEETENEADILFVEQQFDVSMNRCFKDNQICTTSDNSESVETVNDAIQKTGAEQTDVSHKKFNNKIKILKTDSLKSDDDSFVY